jgi:hypothetical protein
MAHPTSDEQCLVRIISLRFIEMFWILPPNGVQKFLALDEDRVKLNINTGQVFERDTWFGAPFNDDIASIPNGMIKLDRPRSGRRKH